MLSAYFDSWQCFWRAVGTAMEKEKESVKWLVEFGEIRKPLDHIHPDTGIPKLAAPLRKRIEALDGDAQGLTVVLKIDPTRGLLYALQGREPAVRRAQAALRS